MASQKPAALPPDTAHAGGDPPPGVLQDAAGHNSAESPESLDSQAPVIGHSLGSIITAGVHPVIFTVFKDGNALRFLSDLLIALQAVDSTAKILPHSAADSTYVPLGRTKDIPTNSSAKIFVKAYLADLKMSEKGDMKGKVMIQMQAQFKNLKRNTTFRTWFEGSTVAPLRPVVKLDKTKLKGPRRISAGLFFNVVARHDMTKNFELQITNALGAKTQISGPTPEFEIEVYSMHGPGGRVRLYRVFASSISEVQILNEKLAVIMPKPTADISYIPQKVWDSLLRPKKTEYYNMQRHFALSHNALRFVGLKNARQLLAKTAQNVPAASIFTWLTRIRSTDNFILFPKVFLCEDGDIELWYHMSHDKETRAWLSTALAEIAKLSGINWEINPAAADAMFKQPLKVWNSLAKLKRGVSLPAQRSVFMDYSPPTGIITFPTRAAVQNRQRQGPKSFKLVYDMDVATTVSSMTNDDTKSRASSKSRKSARNRANKEAKATASTTTPNTVSPEQLAAKVAATKAIAIADAAVTKYPPRAPLAHQGAYDTIYDEYGNQFPVVRIGDKWAPLNADSLRESRRKAPPPNFGLAGKVHGAPNNQSGSTGSTAQATLSVETTTANAGQTPSFIAATSSADTPGGSPATTQQQTTAAKAPGFHQQHGAVKTKVTAIVARVAAIPDHMDTTIAIDGPLDTAVEDDGSMVVEIDDISTQYGSAASLGTNSCVTTTTLGESSVTWAKVAAHQVYDPAAIPETVAHNQDAGSVGSVDTNFQSSLVKLQSKSKQQQVKTRRQQSSLEVAAAAGAVIYRPQGSSLAKVAAPDKELALAIVPMEVAVVASEHHASSAAILHQLAKLQDENALLMQMVLRLQKENDTAKDKAKVRDTTVALAPTNTGGQSSLARSSQSQSVPPPTYAYAVEPAATVGHSSLARLLQAQQVPTLALPRERIDSIGFQESEGDRQLTVFQTPPRRKSRKTPHEYEFVAVQRTPPRPPEGQPLTAKKTRITNSPNANRFAILSEAEADDEFMDDADSYGSIEEDSAAPSVAEVDKKMAAVNIRTHHSGPDSYKNKGAGLHK